MSWTYADDLAHSTLFQVRFLIQDTNTNRQLFSDEEVQWTLSQEANVYCAAAALCDVLVAKAGGVRSKRISEFSISYDPVFYRALGGQLRARGAGHQVPYAGGISIADKLAQQQDSDWPQPRVTNGLDNNPQAPQPSSPPMGSSDPLTQT